MATRGQDRRAQTAPAATSEPERSVGAVQRTLRRLLPSLAHLPLVTSGAVRRFADDPARGRAALERAVPTVGGRRPRDDHPLVALDRAVAEDRYGLARELLDRIAAQDPSRPGAELAVDRLAGHLHRVADSAASDARGRRAVRRARADLQVLGSPLPTWCAQPAAPGESKEPRILHVVTNSLPRVQAGSTIRTQRIARAQLDAGWDAQVVTRPGYPVTRGEAWARDREEVDGVTYHRLLPWMMPDETRIPEVYARELGALVDRLRPELLHAASDQVNARAALEVGRRAGLPVAYEARSFFEDTWLGRHGSDASTDTYGLLRDRHTEILLAADVVTTLGEAMREEIIARGVAPDRVIVAPNAVPAQFLTLPDRPKSAVRESLGLPVADLWVGSVATLNPDEGFDILLQALARLRADGADARALIVGDGPATMDLQEQARRLDVPLVMPGRVAVADVLPWYDALDVFAFPRHDTALNRLVTGLKPVEAQARGIPVVGSDLPAVHEVLGPGGALVAPADVE
ncbi:MAG: glycosyltransferase family 4 protein, partial [Candidatus Nanopelagicales bacterium]